MSWLFGYKKQEPQMPTQPGDNSGNIGAGQATKDPELTKAEKKAMEAYRFDSSALERAAESARTLEKSSE